jgi:hypothetical protein
MFECIHKRIKRVNQSITQLESPASSSGTASSVDIEEQLSGQLFCSTTGQMAARAPCNLTLFQPGPQHSFSNEEQLHMIEALLKLQIAGFKSFLTNVWKSGQAVGNQARQSKVNSLLMRLDKAASNITEELRRTSHALSDS